ncbi:DUF4907 domain-containing protein [Carboxylicivirga marina]|uniref:DUF4907 domain-containing protein n=1 Tax=Carboxylicivirga marina TaxID=2800988 RepID=A0ABS1HF98_9BACT|nr:DUF4907 domain-containing protein [Carboxylicivirga marina]MBK3516318.1 DUF4907 domain-containing protein [Carboxylicivirga marina]
MTTIKAFQESSLSIQVFLKWGIAFLVVVSLVAYFLELNAEAYSYKIHKVESGYGYQVFNNDKLLIQQDFIPTLEGYIPFDEKNKAEAAAKLVISKLKDKQRPALTNLEIENIIQ